MNLEEQNAALQKRALLANKNWGSFFSKMPLRDSPPICVITAATVLTSIVDRSAQIPVRLSEQDFSGGNVNNANFVSRGNGSAFGCKDDSLREVYNVINAR